MTRDRSVLPDKKTKIVATIGPATQSHAMLEQLIANGMNVARINFSHGDLENHRQVIANVRAAAAALGRRVAIMGDLPGPKMRIGKLAVEPVMLERGQSFTIEAGDFVGDASRVSMRFEGLPQAVKPGDSIYINDGYHPARSRRLSMEPGALPGRGGRRAAVTQRRQLPRHRPGHQRLHGAGSASSSSSQPSRSWMP